MTRADGQPFPQPNASAQMWVPVAGGPAFLLGPNFYSVKSYNPSMNYALAICHLGDRILGAPPFIHPFPGSERALTLAEVQEMQTRLTKAGFDTGGTDGRVGNDTMKAVKDYQTKMGLLPADGYGGLKVLARLRQGGSGDRRHCEERSDRGSVIPGWCVGTRPGSLESSGVAIRPIRMFARGMTTGDASAPTPTRIHAAIR